MHIHIAGICGTFMGGLALLARQKNFRVTGCDEQVYPPMSTQLTDAGIDLIEGYDPKQLALRPDCVVIGNALSRGNPLVEAVLNQQIPYTSGPQFLAEHILAQRWVLAVAGTHGKTTTSAMLAWILEDAGLNPGFLIGGVPQDFQQSARLGRSDFFVMEADEYDTAFFDKRSKFVHYRPRTLILNNLEFDHADIFDNLAAIERQFHHVVRTVPSEGQIILPAADAALQRVLQQGVWTPVQRFGSWQCPKSPWQVKACSEDGTDFELWHNNHLQGRVQWTHSGEHNQYNALAAVIAAKHVGVLPEQACRALSQFQGVKRRMEPIAQIANIALFDDFAHHPTAIATTLAGARKRYPQQRIIAVIEPRSNTMRQGQHRAQLASSCAAADQVIWYQPSDLSWSLQEVADASTVPSQVLGSIDAIIAQLVQQAQAGDCIIMMSNGSFDGLHNRLIHALQQHHKSAH